MSIDEIKNSVGIGDVATVLIAGLRPKGADLLGCCPFHNERTPSFRVRPTKGTFKCFGCGKGGDVIDLVEGVKNLDTSEAVKWLNEYTGNAPAMPNGWQKAEAEPKPLDYLPLESLRASMIETARPKNGFFVALARWFGADTANDFFKKYNVGTSRHWHLEAGELATSFWQVDVFGNPRQVKIMAYNPTTGRRLKESDLAFRRKKNGDYFRDIDGDAKTAFAGKWILGRDDAHLEQCFFGEHLLADDHLADEKKSVAIVESEKTAIVCAVLMPQFIWLATGGANGCRIDKPERAAVLQGRAVHLFPDLKKFDEWQAIGEKLAAMLPTGRVSCIDILERRATDADRLAGFDLADFLLRNCDPTTGRVMPFQAPTAAPPAEHKKAAPPAMPAPISATDKPVTLKECPF